MKEPRIVIITGLSGAGKSEAMKAFEDLGFFCVDNLPPVLIPKFAELCAQSGGRINKIALVIDVRGRDFFNSVTSSLEFLEEAGFVYEVLYLEAREDVLVRRFKESRRRHPLTPEGGILEGIREETEMLHELKGKATMILDTTDLSVRQLRERIAKKFGPSREESLLITLVSFGFRHGIPLDADLVFDVRFLPNPNYVDYLRDLDGNSPEVAKYVLRWPVTNRFLAKTRDLLAFLVPQYIKEGKPQLIIGIGCTGGRHRSVTITNRLADFLRTKGYQVTVNHRDAGAKGE